MEVDLSELDDWLGTLEELQLGLELCHSVTGASNKLPDAAAPTSSSCVNRTFLNEASSPRVTVPATYPAPSGHFNPLVAVAAGDSSDSYQTRFASNQPDASQHGPTVGTRAVNGTGASIAATRAAPDGKPPIGLAASRGNKEATAERDLSSLLQELEVVEERMKELESENTTFTRRYSLASSPQGKRPCDDQLQSTDFTSASVNCESNSSVCARPKQPASSSSSTNGFVSAQWAAQLNPDLGVDREQSCSPPPPPPAFLGAGDACVSPPTSPQPSTPSIALLQQTEAGIWSMNPQNMAPREPSGSMGLAKCDPAPTPALSTTPMPMSQSGPGFAAGVRNVGEPRGSPGISITPKQTNHQSNHSAVQCHMQAVPCASVRAVDVTHACGRLVLSDPALIPPSRSPAQPVHQTGHCPSSPDSRQPILTQSDGHYYSSTGALNASGTQSALRATDGDEGSSLSGIGSWSPCQGRRDLRRDLVKTNSLVGQGGSDGLSNSLSPESSLSDKSFSESTDLIHRPVVQSSSTTEGQVKKLVVRIFRPDRTTKAILIEEQMTAGEVASMMIEKNFLQPSTRLAVVEKVPALKIERVFEEHEKVADCILAWPTRSQNMLFFEERDDHFGLIESPGEWLGEEFVTKYRYENSEAMQMMLNNIEQAGFPEWRDYLYIRKPGDKTWSRRLCVLRSSGLYTSKKNRKVLNPTDLIRILVLDSHLQLYTTTGGWTRMRAPTPHGFAFKPYSAQDPASMHVFCFCATDEKALRHWVARLRIAKYGRQLFMDYQAAIGRVQRQLTLRHGSFSMNGSLSAGLHRKSSFDFLSTSSNPTLTNAESSSSLVTGTSSPSVYKRCVAVPTKGMDSNMRPMADERLPFNNQFRQQSHVPVDRSTVSPLCSGTHTHIGLRPCTPQGPVDPHQAHFFGRMEEARAPTQANLHLSCNPAMNATRNHQYR